MILTDATLAERARALEWLLFDVDGVFTDGRLVYGSAGEELKVFHVRDGLGLKLAQKAGLKVGILSGRISEALRVRAGEIGMNALLMDRSDKEPAFDEFLASHGTAAERVAYLGDDLLDIPVLCRCGLSFAPADAVAEVRGRVDRVLLRKGGDGVVREMCEVVLHARGQWEELIARYLGSDAGTT